MKEALLLVLAGGLIWFSVTPQEDPGNMTTARKLELCQEHPVECQQYIRYTKGQR